MNTFLLSITNLILNILGFFCVEPMIVLMSICLCIITMGFVKWLF